VIILDADNPMTEIRGTFVWADDHTRVVDDARRAAYAEGFADGAPSWPAVVRRRAVPAPFEAD
jgi:hypothetical protein